ncbi:MAG: hypothetical protein DRN06_09305, partial [Thermoprotei archaeon]
MLTCSSPQPINRPGQPARGGVGGGMARAEGGAILIKNGFVFDPWNGIDGERMDIAIMDGRIVEDVPE